MVNGAYAMIMFLVRKAAKATQTTLNAISSKTMV